MRTGIHNWLTFLLILPCFSAIGQEMPVDFSGCDFTAVAHRGYSEFYPENTLIAIEEAFKRGIKYCEVDVAVSSDGVYVLHHDPYTISRTTTGEETVADNTYARLSVLDAGGWKASFFEGEKVPRLVDALKIAQKYDACLYLDVKAFDPEGLALALSEAGVDANRMMPAITSLDAAREFRQYCPESPWVWFGSDPEDPNEDNWFQERIEIGCKVFELAEDKVLFEKNWALNFIENAHSFGGKVWAYTINNEVRIKEFADLGIDGVETDRPYVAQLFVCGYEPVSIYPKKETTGNWDFKKKNFENTGVGSKLKNLQRDSTLLQSVEFGNTSDFGIVSVNGKDTMVAKIPAYTPENGLFAYDNFMMEDSGAVDYSYSVIMDILIESKDSGGYIALLQTSPDNLNDADFFIAPDASLGTYGEYYGEFTFDEWHRVVFVHDGLVLNIYMDGAHLGDISIEGSRWTVFNNMAYHGKFGLLLFADDDDETSEVYLNALQLRNYAMDATEISDLGRPNASGIPVNNKKLFSTGIGNLESEMVDWEEQIIYIKETAGGTEAGMPYSLQLSYGAEADIPVTGSFSFSGGKESFRVTAADGSSSTWAVQRLFPVGVNDLREERIALVYPNPFNQYFKIKVDAASGMELFNMMGQILYRRNLVKGENIVNTSELPAGTYLYKVQNMKGEAANGILIKSN